MPQSVCVAATLIIKSGFSIERKTMLNSEEICVFVGIENEHTRSQGLQQQWVNNPSQSLDAHFQGQV